MCSTSPRDESCTTLQRKMGRESSPLILGLELDEDILPGKVFGCCSDSMVVLKC